MTALLALAWLAAVPNTAAAQQHPPGWNPTDSIRKLPGYRPAHDTIPLLTPARIAKYAPGEQAAWRAYIARSETLHARDTASMNAELRAIGRDTMARAPYTHDFDVKPWMTPAWFATDSARRMADIILTFQAPNGGWSKHVDFTQGPRRPGQSYFAESNEWAWISTIDNSSTTEEMRFLALADRARPDERYRAAFLRGLEYLLAAQYPNGGWPQNYPLEGSYHDAITYNDDAMVNVLEVLHDVARGEYAFVPAEARRRAEAAFARGVECILNTQVVVNGKRTVWGQQHDPLTLEPTSARSYELTSLVSRESVTIVRFLMGLPSPSPRVVDAVYSAVDWFRATPVYGYAYAYNKGLAKQEGAGPLWARMYEIGSNRPIFSNRDGIKLYDWNQLTDRRQGYAWYDDDPIALLKAFERWSREHPRPLKVTKEGGEK